MGSLDSDEAVIKILYNTLIGDSELQNILGDFKIYNLHAGKDPEGDYFTHKLNSSKVDTGRRNGTYTLNWYTLSTDSNGNKIESYSKAWDVKRRIFILLDDARLATQNAGVVRVSNNHCNPISEPEKGIQHYVSQWNIRYFAKELVEEINSR